MHWIIDESLEERENYNGFPSLAEAARAAGHDVHLRKYVPFSHHFPTLDIPIGECVVVHGTINFCLQYERDYGRDYTPGLYMNSTVKQFHAFASYMADDLLNDDYYIIPWSEVVRRNLNGIFVKPLSGLKTFVGQVISNHDYNIQPNSPIDPDCLCVVSKAKDIKAEFRFIIAENKVVTGSEYRWDNVLDIRQDVHPMAQALAEKIAANEWQADTVYTCDVALVNDIAKVIELNAFSSSGLYACDTNKIVEAVSAAAIKEHEGL